MSDSVPLPPEIWECIIDQVGASSRDDRRSRIALIRCSSLCRTFWMRARYHIFSIVQIKASYRVSIEEKLNALLACMAPSEPSFSTTWLIKSFSLDTTHQMCRQLELINLPSLAAILQKFVDAKVLRCLTLITAQISWQTVDQSTRNLIHTLCRMPTFTSLSLPHLFAIPGRFFEGATIKHLALQDVRRGPDFVTQWDALSSLPQLESLEVSRLAYIPQATHASTSNKKPALPFSRLVKFSSTNIELDKLPATFAFAKRSSQSLQTLHLSSLGFWWGHLPVNSFDLAQFPNLLNFRVGLSRGDHDITAVHLSDSVLNSLSTYECYWK